jgi:hypothetical protein
MIMALNLPPWPGLAVSAYLGAIGNATTEVSAGNRVNELATEQGFEPPIVFLSDTTLCPIVTLPHELIFEITNWTNHPADILSLALTNRYFHSILLPPRGGQTHSDATWRHARQRMHFISPLNNLTAYRSTLSDIDKESLARIGSITWTHAPIPKPYEGMGEDTLMIILWGPKVCMSCKRTFNETPKVLGLNCFWCKGCDSYVSYLSIIIFSIHSPFLVETRSSKQLIRHYTISSTAGATIVSFIHCGGHCLEYVREGPVRISCSGIHSCSKVSHSGFRMGEDYTTSRAWRMIKEKWKNMPRGRFIAVRIHLKERMT